MATRNDVLHRELVSRIKKNDLYAYELFFNSYQRRLTSFANIYLKNNELTQEVIDSVYLKFWDDRSRLDEAKSIKIALFIETHRCIFHFLHHRKLDHVFTAELKSELLIRLHLINIDGDLLRQYEGD